VADVICLIPSRPGSPTVVRKRASSTVSLLAISEEENVHHLLADTLGVEQSKLGVTDDFRSHGLDSLSAAEVLRALREEFNVSLPQDLFLREVPNSGTGSGPDLAAFGCSQLPYPNADS